jgi:ABC-2 type transport system permease protein
VSEILSRQSWRVVGELGRRSVKQTFRRPQLMAPLIVFPTLLLAIQTGGAGRAVDLPGFPPVESFLAFMLAGAMVQSTLLAGNSSGIALAVDIEMGFTDRLLVAPIPRFSIVLGRLAGTAALGLFTAIWFLTIGFAFGVTFTEGPLGVLVMILLVIGSAVAFGSIGAAIALRSGSASVVQGMFPIVFVILFLSTAFFPQDLLLEPAQTVAEYNPLSFIVNAIRDPVVFTFSAEDLLKGLLGLVVIGSVGTLLAARALRHRLRTGG